MSGIRIGDHQVGLGQAPFVIAEMSGNHNGSLSRALELVDLAAAAGAHALKIQTYTADTMTIDVRDGEFYIDDPGSLWRGHSLYELYEQAHTPWDWHGAIFERCRERRIIGFSSPFDASAVDFLDGLGVPCFKIASFEIVDHPLIRKAASKGKPLIMSTGMASLAEIDDAVKVAREAGCRDLVLLKCTSTYPADPRDSNLATIPHLRQMFGCEVGLSDHTLGIGAACASAALGATVIEKHFTDSREKGGVDSAFSLEPAELKTLVEESARAAAAVGGVAYGPSLAERGSLKHRRSLYITKDIARGEVLDGANVRAIRPGLGLPPRYTEVVLGRRAARDLKKGTPVSWDVISN